MKDIFVKGRRGGEVENINISGITPTATHVLNGDVCPTVGTSLHQRYKHGIPSYNKTVHIQPLTTRRSTTRNGLFNGLLDKNISDGVDKPNRKRDAKFRPNL